MASSQTLPMLCKELTLKGEDSAVASFAQGSISYSLVLFLPQGSLPLVTHVLPQQTLRWCVAQPPVLLCLYPAKTQQIVYPKSSQFPSL